MTLCGNGLSHKALRPCILHSGCLRRPASRPVAFKTYAQGNGSRIIIPGADDGRFPGRGSSPDQDRRFNQHSRLIIPSQESSQQRTTGKTIDTSGIQGPSTPGFRPPPGFMDAETPASNAYGPLDVHEARAALDRIRAQAGHWHELAQLLPRLAASGYDAQTVELETGIERVVQNSWIVAQSVHSSLLKSDKLPAAVLEYFDDPEGANMLYHLRFLTAPARIATSTYIAENRFDAPEAGVLERAVKEYERRDGGKLGFADTPADCLAFKYYRDAVESRSNMQRQQLVERALSIAETESARARISSILEESTESVGVKPKEAGPSLEIVRLTGEEIEFRPICLAGEMSEVRSDQVASAAGVRQSGTYNSFTVGPETVGQEFVALPAFRSLLLARSPVALSMANCAGEPLILRATNSRTEEERRRQQGPGLVVIDRVIEDTEPLRQAFYVKQYGTGCRLIGGDTLSDMSEIIGKVLFLCRPPARFADSKLNSYALLSV